jgi:diguanylate cyclase (GGDEF)-like protein
LPGWRECAGTQHGADKLPARTGRAINYGHAFALWSCQIADVGLGGRTLAPFGSATEKQVRYRRAFHAAEPRRLTRCSINRNLVRISYPALMGTGRHIDRRKKQAQAVRLGQPLFMRVPKVFAAPFLTACALLAILANHATPHIAFGPFFLLICALGAWFVGTRFAVLLSLFVAAVQILSGYAAISHDAPIILVLKMLSALAVVLMLGVARAALEIEWQYARIDPLTGALNRKAFFEVVESEACKSGLTVLVYADIDGLKCLNDQFGHDAGDRALINIANRVRNTIRKTDLFARIGGDEFGIILKVSDLAAADVVVQRLNKALNIDPLEAEDHLRCSLGVLVMPAGSSAIDAELKQADALMYDAKKAHVGVMMAIAIKGDEEGLIPFPHATNSAGQHRAALRSGERSTEQPTGENADAAAAGNLAA